MGKLDESVKKDRLREVSMEIVVGAFMFFILLALAVLTIVLSRENFLAPSYRLEVSFPEVMGLREGDNVTTRGVVVGRVKDVRVNDRDVVVLCSLNTRLTIHQDYRAEIVASSVLGGQHLSIDTGQPDSPLLAEGTPLRGLPPVDLVHEASTAIKSIRETLVDGGVLDNLKSTMEQINRITAKLEQGEGTIGKLLSDPKVYDDLSSLSANLRDIGDRLAKGEGTLGKLLSEDATLYEDMQDIVGNLKEVSDRLADGKGTIGKLLSEDDTLYNDLSASAASIRKISESIGSGEGTLGKLATDDELYEEARLLLQEIRATVDDLRETAPITTFTSIFFGAF